MNLHGFVIIGLLFLWFCFYSLFWAIVSYCLFT